MSDEARLKPQLCRPASPCLLGLPLELREIIYGYVYDTQPGRLIIKTSRQRRNEPRGPLSLILASKQIYLETYETSFQMCQIEIPVRTLTKLPTVVFLNKDFIRSLFIEWRSCHGDFLLKWAGRLQSLQHVELHVNEVSFPSVRNSIKSGFPALQTFTVRYKELERQADRFRKRTSDSLADVNFYAQFDITYGDHAAWQAWRRSLFTYVVNTWEVEHALEEHKAQRDNNQVGSSWAIAASWRYLVPDDM